MVRCHGPVCCVHCMVCLPELMLCTCRFGASLCSTRNCTLMLRISSALACLWRHRAQVCVMASLCSGHVGPVPTSAGLVVLAACCPATAMQTMLHCMLAICDHSRICVSVACMILAGNRGCGLCTAPSEDLPLAAAMNNYMMFSGTEGVYTHTTKYARSPECPCCGSGTAVEISPDMTLKQVCPAVASRTNNLTP